MFCSAVNPKWLTNSPTNNTNVTPNEIPKIFSLPKYTPNAITKAYNMTVWATELVANNRF